MHGRGIRHRLQGYVPALRETVANAFDLRAWQEATSLGSFGVELCVASGLASVSLRQIAPDGTNSEFARIECSGAGSAYSPPIMLGEHQGAFLPVVEAASDNAEFDIYFGTNETPFNPHARVAFLLDGQGTDTGQAIDAFRAYLDAYEDHGARDTAALVIVGGQRGPEAGYDPAIHHLTDSGPNSISGIGRGLYDIAYGPLSAEGFSHACLLRSGLRLHPEMFARSIAFIHFMRPQMLACAPLYDGELAASGAARCIGFGERESGAFPGGLIPQDIALDPNDLNAILHAGRWDRIAAWTWCCLDLDAVYRHGLPVPFHGRMSEIEFSARLRQKGLRLAVPTSFWAEQVQSFDAPLRFRDHWAMLAMQYRLGDPKEARTAFDGMVRARIDAGDGIGARDLMDDMSAFLNGPETAFLSTAAESRTIGNLLPKTRLNSQLRELDRLPEVAKRFAAARHSQSGLTYWSRLSAKGTAATGPKLADDAAIRDRQLADLHLKVASLQRQQSVALERRIDNLEGRLNHGRLLDTNRMLEDQDRANRTMLSLLRNRHKDRRGVIVGNGPSLLASDLDRLKGEVTFASNKIYLAYESTSWRPTYYSVEDHLVILNNWDRIAALPDSIKIFPANVRDFGYHAGDTIFAPFRPPQSFEDPLSDPDFPGFSEDLSHGICWGSTIVYSQIQMAVHLGCSEIYLIGVDHSYQLPGTKVGREYIHEGEQNHFHPEYRAMGERWHQPNLDVLEVSYAQARDRCAELGIPIYNASRRTCLDVFERVDFDTVFPAQSA